MLQAEFGLERRPYNLIYWRADSVEHPGTGPERTKAFDTTVIILLGLYT